MIIATFICCVYIKGHVKMVITKDQSNGIVYAMLFLDSVDIHRENYWGGSLRKLWVEMHWKYLCLLSTVSTCMVFDGMGEKP